MLAAVLAVAAVDAQERFRFERQVVTTGPGPQRLAVDVALVAAGQPFTVIDGVARDGLADLRLFTAEGAVVPHLLVHAPAREREWVPAVVLPVVATEKTSGFEADLGAPGVIDGLAVEGLPAPFLKRLTLEGSGDRQRWTALVPEGTLFDLPDESLRQLDLPFVPGSYRYLRVTWNDANSGRLPTPRAVRARRAGVDAPPAPLVAELPFTRLASEPGRSRYRLILPGPRLPIVALELSVPGTHVFRAASVNESRLVGDEAVPIEIGRARLRQVIRGGFAAGALRIPVAPPSEAELELVIDDGSNPPLDLARISAVFAELPWIYFDAPPGVLIARYGDPAATPAAYDLEAVRGTIDLASLTAAGWGVPRPPAARPEAAPPELPTVAGAALDTRPFEHLRGVSAAGTGLFVLPLDAAVLAESRGPRGHFADVRLVDADGRQVPYLIERREGPIALDLPFTAGEPPGERRPAGHVSAYRLSLPYPNLPDARLVVETTSRVFRRELRVATEPSADRRRRSAALEVLAAAPWVHADQQSAAPLLTIALPATGQRELWLIVEEGDNAPLPVASVRLLLPSYRLRFFRLSESPLRLAYGHRSLPPPQYDLSLLASRVMGAAASDAALDAAARPPSSDSLMSRRTFYVLLAVAVVALLALVARLALQSDGADGMISPP
jgi:hypothetical protein